VDSGGLGHSTSSQRDYEEFRLGRDKREISIRLEDYEKALKKHGIKTVPGTIEES